jgi:hypothetical protein
LGTTEDELIEAAVPRQAAVGYPRWGDQARDLRPSSLDQLAAAMLAAAEPHAHLLEPSGIRVEDWVLVTRSVLDHLVANRGGPWTPTPAFLDSLSPMARKLVGALAMSVALPANRAAPDASEG